MALTAICFQELLDGGGNFHGVCFRRKMSVSRSWTFALGKSFRKASAPAGRKKGSFLPHTASKGGFDSRKYF